MLPDGSTYRHTSVAMSCTDLVLMRLGQDVQREVNRIISLRDLSTEKSKVQEVVLRSGARKWTFRLTSHDDDGTAVFILETDDDFKGFLLKEPCGKYSEAI